MDVGVNSRVGVFLLLFRVRIPGEFEVTPKAHRHSLSYINNVVAPAMQSPSAFASSARTKVHTPALCSLVPATRHSKLATSCQPCRSTWRLCRSLPPQSSPSRAHGGLGAARRQAQRLLRSHAKLLLGTGEAASASSPPCSRRRVSSGLLARQGFPQRWRRRGVRPPLLAGEPNADVHAEFRFSLLRHGSKLS